MSIILSCLGLEDHAGPDHGSSNFSDLDCPNGLTTTTSAFDTACTDGDAEPLGSFDELFESDDLLEALARASGMYGASPNGHRTPDGGVETDAAGAGCIPPGPPDGPSDGDYPSGDNNGDGNGGSAAPWRCEHGQPMLCTDDLTGWWGRPEPGVPQPVWWCPRWCARTDRDGVEIDPAEWVHRSQSRRIAIGSGGTVTARDGRQVAGSATVTIRAEKHPARPVRFVLGIAIDGVEHACTMTVSEAQLLYGFQDVVMAGLTGNSLTGHGLIA